MRPSRATFFTLLLTTPILAVQLTPSGSQVPPARKEALQAEARLFARQLLGVLSQVADQYVRPVSREELLRSALAGLYEAARRPVPHHLEERIRLAARLAPPPLPG